MTALKIDPSRLPYRGKPTKDARPEKPKIPPHIKVKTLKSPWTKERRQKASEARKKRARENSKRNHPHAWTDEQEALALKMFLADEPYEEMVKAIGKSKNSIRIRIYDLRKRGMEIPYRKSERAKEVEWTDAEEATVIRMHEAGASTQKIADAIGRSKSSVRWRITMMRKRGIEITDTRIYNRYGQRKEE